MSNAYRLLTNAMLCVAPFIVVPIASITAIMGPCAGIRSTGSGIALFLVSMLGVVSVASGIVRWARMGTLPAGAKLLKIATCLAGAVALMTNGFFALFAGLQLGGILWFSLRGQG